MSGPEALAVVAPLVRERTAWQAAPARVVRRVTLVDSRTGNRLDDALCTVMRAPASYTGEDTVELSCHGSPALLRLLIEQIVDAGARLAEPGEFTRRAFLNGRMDLAQAEAVALLIGARTERAITLAARAVGGALSDRLRHVHEGVLDVVAGLEVTLDFPEENVGLEVEPAAKMVSALRDEVGRLLEAARRGHVAHAGLTMALVGAPNAGKSSLLNALLGHERAIVSPEPGTTRDVVDGVIVLEGVPVRLLDTAGLGVARDPIDAEGMRRTRRAMAESDAVIVVLDGSVAVESAVLAETAGRPHVLVRAKADLPTHHSHVDLDAVAVSALGDLGIDALLTRLVETVRGHAGIDGDEGGLVASLRQLELLEALHCSLDRCVDTVRTVAIEGVLVDLREALGAAASILGISVGDAVLDRVFSSFCLGK